VTEHPKSTAETEGKADTLEKTSFLSRWERVINLRKEERFDFLEGEVVLTYPADLSPGSIEDLEAYLGIFLKKAKREHKAKARATFEEMDKSIPKSLGGQGLEPDSK
jgi:hypothetical protein